jgi:hypothetical protein
LRGANNFTFDDSCKNDQANRWPRKAQVLVGTNRVSDSRIELMS